MTGFPNRLTLDHFSPAEFDHPDKVDPELLELLDEVRHRCGFPIRVNDDARTLQDVVDIYGPQESWPDWLRESGSPHQIHDDGYGHAVDVEPAGDHDWSTFHTRKMEIACHAFGLRSIWPNQGIEVGTSHVHLDTSPKLKRPYYWGGESR